MKRQFYFDDVERDLLRTALEFWRQRLTDGSEVCGTAHACAKRFTTRRINELLARLQEEEQHG